MGKHNFKALAYVVAIVGFLATLGIVTINEYGGFSKTVHYWWYCTACVFVVGYFYIFLKDFN